jgi:hypothetical protein
MQYTKIESLNTSKITGIQEANTIFIHKEAIYSSPTSSLNSSQPENETNKKTNKKYSRVAWTEEEEYKLLLAYKKLKNKWNAISKETNLESGNNLKNKFYSILRRVRGKIVNLNTCFTSKLELYEMYYMTSLLMRNFEYPVKKFKGKRGKNFISSLIESLPKDTVKRYFDALSYNTKINGTMEEQEKYLNMTLLKKEKLEPLDLKKKAGPNDAGLEEPKGVKRTANAFSLTSEDQDIDGSIELKLKCVREPFEGSISFDCNNDHDDSISRLSLGPSKIAESIHDFPCFFEGNSEAVFISQPEEDEGNKSLQVENAVYANNTDQRERYLFTYVPCVNTILPPSFYYRPLFPCFHDSYQRMQPSFKQLI